MSEDLFASSEGGRLFYATNRFNLLEILSSGYIGSRADYAKYYQDLLDISPEWIPLIQEPVAAHVLDHVRGEAAGSFAVLLELDGLLRSRELTRIPSSLPSFFAAPYAIPLERVARVHLRSDVDLSEHRARSYANVRMDCVEYVVSPELFIDAPSGTGEAGVEALRALDPRPRPNRSDYRLADAVLGALTMAAVVLPADQALVAGFADVLAGSASQALEMPTAFPALDSTRDDAEKALFAVALQALLEVEVDTGLQAERVVDEIRTRIGNAEPRVLDDLASVRAVLRTEVDFDPYGESPSTGSARALLLALLRPDPQKQVDWSPADSGARPPVRVAAAMLVGTLHGRKRLPTTLRPEALDRYLAALAVRATYEAGGRQMAIDRVEVHEAEEETGERRVLLAWRGQPLFERTLPAPALGEVLAQQDLTVGTWNAAAIELCRRMDWPDCVKTIVAGSRGTLVATTLGRESAIEVTVPGIAAVSYQIDAGLLVEHIAGGVPADVQRDVLAIANPTQPQSRAATVRRRRGTKPPA